MRDRCDAQTPSALESHRLQGQGDGLLQQQAERARQPAYPVQILLAATNAMLTAAARSISRVMASLPHLDTGSISMFAHRLHLIVTCQVRYSVRPASTLLLRGKDSDL